MINTELLLESIKEAILMLDKEGYILYANQATLTLTGFQPTDLLNRHITLFYNVENDNETDQRVKAEYELGLAVKKEKFVSEGWKAKKDGTRFWGELTYTVISEEGKNNGFSCLLRDVSDRKSAELELRKSEEQFRLIVEGVKDYAIFLLDPTGHIVTWNEGAKRNKGYSSYEVIGKHFSIFYTREDLDIKKPENELRIAVATGKYEEEGWRVKKNGSVFWANIVITALFNDQNKLVGFSKVTRDLTERKGNEEQLRVSEERYRLLVEQVTDYGIFMLDEKGRIISWNEGAKKIKGYTQEEIIGKYFSIFYPEEDILNGKPAYELKIAKTEGKYDEEGWRLRKDGTRFWANVVITAVFNHEGVLIGYSKVTKDLTERKESEKALRESYERYRMLANQLKGTNIELSYANKELEQFTSIVSHDLQEPIRTIKSFLQLIEMKLSEKEYTNLQTYIGKSIGAANRMKELIQNLLHYSQLSKDMVVESEINVRDLISEVLQNLRSAIEASRATITVETELDIIEGDPIQLTQLLQNLISNSLKFTNGSDPSVKIRCIKEDGHVQFSVSDNGIGFDKTDRLKIFEIFRRLHTKNEYPGMGIGLAICKKIVDRHGGRIWPESEPGKGTTFYFTLKEETKGRLPIT